ncbi:MAG: hypothetical protein QOE61_701, partial [Micromonosporaceae bacterium]|nr:hypothetical protein [Micromonosporaceae bacterium]
FDGVRSSQRAQLAVKSFGMRDDVAVCWVGEQIGEAGLRFGLNAAHRIAVNTEAAGHLTPRWRT